MVPTAESSWFIELISNHQLATALGVIISVCTIFAIGFSKADFLAHKVASIWRFPIQIYSAGQFETKKGYVFDLSIVTQNGELIYIPKDDFAIEIIHDPVALAEMTVEERRALLHGEHVQVFDNRSVLNAAVSGLSYANATRTVNVHSDPQTLYLLLRVKGPGSENPSLRLQLGKVYRSIRILIRKRGKWSSYAEVPLQKSALIAGNKQTHIVEK